MEDLMERLPGIHPSPNIQEFPDIYEIENRAVDPDGKIEAAMWSIASWQGEIVLDLGAGTGFHLPRFHEQAAHVIGVEPHDPSRLRAMARMSAAGLARVSLMTGSAERLLLPDQSVAMIHARFAYFFGPGCEPGIEEAMRVLRPGGTFFIIDNDLRQGTFASWLARVPYFATRNPTTIETFWGRQGFTQHRILSAWNFATREDLEAVVHIEFPQEVADAICSEHQGLSVSYGFNVFWKQRETA
jgi:ubiquinone/menaquinone biosynthesis C-methylase UbiE